MYFHTLVAVSVIWISTSNGQFNHDVEDSPGCTENTVKCSFRWIIEKKQTMIVYNNSANRGYPLFVRDSSFGVRTSCTTQETYNPTDRSSEESVIVGDGTYKYIYTINGMMPGPNIVVYEGTEVEVKITSKLHQETIGIHWHGIHQRGRPWMDGVPGISHCGIQPDESFVYTFIASPVGTHWYHSHLGFQRTDGLFGALIVKPKNQERDIKVTGDFLMLVNDWYNGTGHDNFNSFYHALNVYQWNKNGYGNLEKSNCALRTLQEDGSEVGTIPFHAALINGKGRNRDNAEAILTAQNSLDVFGEVFEVKYKSIVKIRIINAGLNYALRVSVDHHSLHLLESEGCKLANRENEEVVVTDAIVHTGERYEFFLHTHEPPDARNSWIRVEPVHSYEKFVDDVVRPIEDQETVAYPVGVLSYYENSDEELAWPTTEKQACTADFADKKCSSLNCPFREYRADKHRECVNIGDLLNTHPTDEDRANLAVTDIQERIFSFHFPSASDTQLRSAINGIQFMPPSFPPHASTNTYVDGMKFNEDCETKCGPDIGMQPCECTHTVEISTGKMTQFVFVNQVLAPNNIEATAHPVHLHGHSFYVVKVGYPVYNETKGFQSMNSDLTCVDEEIPSVNGSQVRPSRCYKVKWANGTWRETIGDGMNLVNPPVKDTVTVPPGGYVVIRFKADNPGWWLLHCHIELHLAEGMGFIVKEGNAADMPETPGFFPKCGSFGATLLEEKSPTTVATVAVHVDNDQSTVTIGTAGLHAQVVPVLISYMLTLMY